MSNSFFEKLLGFLLGSSWAFLLVGSALVFKATLFLGLVTTFFATFVFLFVAFFLILLLNHFKTTQDILKEQKKQTKLLEQLTKNSTSL